MSIENELVLLGEAKNLIKNAIIDKGVEITPDTPFKEYANKIEEIPTVSYVSNPRYRTILVTNVIEEIKVEKGV